MITRNELDKLVEDLVEKNPDFEVNFDDSIRKLHDDVGKPVDLPDSPYHRVSSLLGALVDAKISTGTFELSDLERQWLSDLLLRLAYNVVALRALGYERSKKRPNRDFHIAQDYLWLRTCGVKAETAIDLIIDKWSESESNVKRLIMQRSYREAAKRRLEGLRQRFAKSNDRAAFSRSLEVSLWKRLIASDRFGRIKPEAQLACDEIERLTANIADST